MVWMDFLRGIAIFLVICWHSAAILALLGHQVPSWLLHANDFFAPFRIPMLMFLSGMLLNRALSKPMRTYYDGKLRNIAWPWLLWTLVHFVVMGTYSSVLKPGLWLLSYLWFLVYLMAFYAMAPLLRRVPTWLLVLVPWAIGFFVMSGPNMRRFFFLAVFFFLGKLASEHASKLQRALASRWTLLMLPVVFGYGLAFSTLGPWRYYPPHIPFSIAGILLAIALASRIGPGVGMSAWSFVGRNSIVYYVVHFPVIVLVVRIGQHLGWNIDVTVAAGLMVAMAVGTGFAVNRATPLGWLFAFPKRRSGRGAERALAQAATTVDDPDGVGEPMAAAGPGR